MSQSSGEYDVYPDSNDCMKLASRESRGVDCCNACSRHREIDMGWLTPAATTRQPGTPGVVIVLVDATGSISPVNKARISAEAMAVIHQFPGSRLWAFGTAVVDITSEPSRLQHSIYECFAGLDLEKDNQQGTYIGMALAQAAQLNPERTIVMSDGGTQDRGLMLRTADRMTGAIDAYYCHPRREEYNLENYYVSANALWRRYSRGADKATMQELARRGGGRCFDYPTQHGIYTDFGIRDAPAMSLQRKVFVGGPQVNVSAPQTSVQTVYRDTHVNVIDRINYHYGQVEEVHHGEDASVDVELGQAQVNVRRQEGVHTQEHRAPDLPRSVWKSLLISPYRSQYRGEIKSAPSLPAPSRQPMQQVAYFSKKKVR